MPSPTGPQIVIADDDREVRDLVKEALTRRGYQVTVVSNGLRLLAALKIDRPELVILDVNMSWMDGFDLCRGLKANPAYASIPVLFLSGKSTPQDIEHGMSCGAAGYLTKPFTLSQLSSTVQKIIEDAKGEPPT